LPSKEKKPPPKVPAAGGKKPAPAIPGKAGEKESSAGGGEVESKPDSKASGAPSTTPAAAVEDASDKSDDKDAGEILAHVTAVAMAVHLHISSSRRR
jgi:hypothetical protein